MQLSGIPLAKTQGDLTPLQTEFLQYALTKIYSQQQGQSNPGGQVDTRADQRERLRAAERERKREA